jgi:hypothetical protein
MPAGSPIDAVRSGRGAATRTVGARRSRASSSIPRTRSRSACWSRATRPQSAPWSRSANASSHRSANGPSPPRAIDAPTTVSPRDRSGSTRSGESTPPDPRAGTAVLTSVKSESGLVACTVMARDRRWSWVPISIASPRNRTSHGSGWARSYTSGIGRAATVPVSLTAACRSAGVVRSEPNESTVASPWYTARSTPDARRTRAAPPTSSIDAAPDRSRRPSSPASMSASPSTSVGTAPISSTVPFGPGRSSSVAPPGSARIAEPLLRRSVSPTARACSPSRSEAPPATVALPSSSSV